jgi:DNA-directed RNA polymerase sigma subunit (sigma70/sigma32)
MAVHQPLSVVNLCRAPDPPPENVELARDQVVEIFASLTEKQRFVLKLSWGLNGDRQYSFREIAELMGVSWQAVQGIHERAMATLRRGYVE